ncbi:MAG: FecCD family ABC transporter permease [Sporichthyaceae bacterium]
MNRVPALASDQASVIALGESDATQDSRRIIARARITGRARALAVGTVLAVIAFAAFCLSLSVGDFPIPLADVVATLVGNGEKDQEFIILQLRLPRALTAILVGAAFGISGAIFQSLARNPLASPDFIGITYGASAAAVFTIVVLDQGGTLVSINAFFGALGAALLIYVLAYKNGVSPYRLILIGIGISYMLLSVISYLLTRAEIFEAARAVVWLTGSLNGRGWEHVRPVGAALLILLPIAVLLTRSLRVLQLGDDAARGLGVRIERSRLALILVAVALIAVGTASAGPIAFVALIAPPIARRLVNAPLTIVPAALTGAVLVLVADLVARRALEPTELPVGIVTGLIGAPYLLFLLARANRVGSGG